MPLPSMAAGEDWGSLPGQSALRRADGDAAVVATLAGCHGGSMPMKKNRIVISVLGGLVQAVYSDLPPDGVDIWLVDWDNIKESAAGAELLCPDPMSSLPDEELDEIMEAMGDA